MHQVIILILDAVFINFIHCPICHIMCACVCMYLVITDIIDS